MSINIGDNFSYLGKKFLDSRQSFDTLKLMNNCSDVPLGFITYCKEDNKRYEYSNTGWIEYKSSITDEEAEKLNIAYLHSQTTHVQADDLEGFATEDFVKNKIAEAQLSGGDVDLSGYATKEYVDDAISNVDVDLSDYVTNDDLEESLADKFDNVELNEIETNDTQTALDFYANGEVVKTVYFTGGGGGNTNAPPYVTLISAENNIVGLGEVFNLELDFLSGVTGKGTLKVFVNDIEVVSKSIPQGENTIPITDDNFIKGNNRITLYVIDRTGAMSNSVTLYVRYGSLEITSDFDAYTAYEPGAVVRYYFTPTAVDTSLALTMYMKIDGEVKPGVSCQSDTRGYYTFPSNLNVGAHYCQAYIIDSAGNTSNILAFNLIILDDTSLILASDTINPSIEEGEQLSLDYKVYMKNNTSFITKIYIDDDLVSTGTCGLDFAYYRTSSLTEGIHTVKLEVYNVTETVSDYIIWTVTITPSTYPMLEPVDAGALFIGTAQNMTNSSDGKEVWKGKDQDGNIVNGILNNFAFNNESGWVDDELLITGASSVEIPITPLANNARYGFTLDIEFASKMIGVEDALVLNLWNEEKDCGIKITTEKVILRSAEGNQADLYFTDSEMTSVMFIIDRNELKAKIYLNGVMCRAFHLSDYIIDGVPYLEDFTVNNTIMLGGSGHARIKNLRVYQVALTTDEILNNFMANERNKGKQKELVEFQKGNHLPTLTVYCDFSGLGKDDKKPCSITYVSTDEEKYGKSFTLNHKKSTCQYQGTSSMAYPIKNYRLNLADEKGNKWKYNFPYGKPERRFTLKADFMSSGHWTNTGLTKWINNNLYNYDLDDEKTMNPKKWYDINNGGSINDTRECIYGFPCRLILVNDGNTPLNEGQNEPTPGNTKDMGIFNFNHDKDATDTMGFDTDVFPNCASYEVTANSDTSAGAFMSFKGVPGNFATGGICETPVGFVNGSYYTPLFPVEMFDGVTTVQHVMWTARTMGVDANFNVLTDIQGEEAVLSNVIVEGVKYVRFKYFNDPNTTIGNVTIKATKKIPDVIPNSIVDFRIKTESDELDYIKQSFELRFPDEDDVEEGWGFMGIPGEEGTGLKALIDWVDKCTDEEFVRDFDQHFNRDYTLRYFLLVITLGMVDNLGKNMMLDTWDNKIFMPRFYDCDTICSYDNSGQLKFAVDIEMTQGYWNTSSSRLWTRIRDLMHDELVAKYNNMRQNGLSYESLMECFYDEQIAKIPQKYYNLDYDVKYAPFADSYIGMANGDTYEHLKRWLQQRLRFVDSLYDYAPSYNNDVLTIRANTTEPMTLEIETYTPVYQHLSWYNNQMDKKKIDGKTSVTFTGTAMAATDQEVLIYGGSNIKSIKGISTMNPNRMLIGSATRLIELDAPNCPLLADINANKANLAPHVYLNKVNLSGCPLLGGNLIVNKSPLVREIDIRGTAITGLNLSSNLRNLEILRLPVGISNLVLNDAGQLHTLEFDEGGILQNVSMTNCNVLTNVTNFDLSNAQQVTLNNSYNTINELYFKNTSTLSLSNMSNLERVIYTPNAEHETFDITNLANTKDYNITTFNCPKLNTFMTTAPYRDSYNNCEIIDIPYIEPCYQTVLEAYNPNGGKFKHTLSNCIFDEDDGVEIEIDVSSCIGMDENIISIGVTSIDYYRTGGTYHFYYNAQNRLLQMFDGSANMNTRITLKDNENIVHIKFNKSGLFINDICYASYSYDDSINTILVGSEEGLNRSNATINHLRYCTEMSNTVIQAKDYGEVKPNEVFEANSIDISSTQFTDVKLLCTTDTNVLKLPQTVKNLIVDSAYDLDTNYLTDGDYDIIHTDLYEQYNTNYKGEIVIAEEVKIENILSSMTTYPAEPDWDTGELVDMSNGGATTEFFDVRKTKEMRLEVIESGSTTRIYFYDENKKLISHDAIGNSITLSVPSSSVYARFYSRINYSVYRLILVNEITPNLIPSASDGSLIFSMYAPHNTTEPASGVWDLKGLEFDNYHTFGLNNDIKLVDDALTMPNRTDDYSVEIVNKNIKGTVAIYTATDNTTFPTFNDGFEYTSSITPKDGVYEYTLVAKDEDVLPTKISFDQVFADDRRLLRVDKLKISDRVTDCVDMFRNNRALEYVNASEWDTSNVTDMGKMFYNCLNLKTIEGIGTCNTGNVTNMNYMFYNCTNLTSLDLSNFNTQNVTNMDNMFYGCNQLTSLDLSNFDTSNVTIINNMFNNCNGLTSLDVSGFDTSKVTSLENMFANCSTLKSLDLSDWKTSNVTAMNSMFNGCNNLTSLDLSNFNTQNVTNMGNMFYNCNNLTSLDLSNFDTSEVTRMNNMFHGCKNLTSLDLSNFDTSNVTIMSYMFQNCTNLTSITFGSNFDASKVTNMGYMFNGCTNLTSLDLSSFDASKVTNMGYMFNGCTNLTSLDLSSFDTSNVTSMGGMFTNCNSLQELHIESWPLNDITQAAIRTLPVGNDERNEIYTTAYFTVPSGWTLINALEIARYTCNTSGVLPTFNTEYTGYSTQETENEGIYTVRIAIDSIDNLPTKISFNGNSNLLTVEYLNSSNVTNMSDMFSNCTNLTSLDVSKFDTSKVTSAINMFHNCNKLTSLDLSNWNTSKVNNMSSIFQNCTNLTSITFGSNFDASKVTNMGYMFNGCTNLTSLDLSSFDTSNVTAMNSMFNGCNQLTSITFGSNFNTNNVINMNYMFYGCNNLTSLDLSNFNTQNVTDMGNMFYGCKNLTSLDVSNFDTSKVTVMNSMFYGCSNLTSLDLSSWSTPELILISYMFHTCTKLKSLDLSGFDTSKVTDMSNMFSSCRNLTSLDSMMNISKSLYLSSTFLDASSLLDVIDNLATVTTTQTLTLGSTLLAKLTEGQIAVAVNKGWTVV